MLFLLGSFLEYDVITMNLDSWTIEFLEIRKIGYPNNDLGVFLFVLRRSFPAYCGGDITEFFEERGFFGNIRVFQKHIVAL